MRYKNLNEGLIRGKRKEPLSSECPPLKKFMKLKCHPTPYGNGYILFYIVLIFNSQQEILSYFCGDKLSGFLKETIHIVQVVAGQLLAKGRSLSGTNRFDWLCMSDYRLLASILNRK